LAVQGRSKLGLKFYGPFWMGECVGMVAYKLELLVGARVHNVFHVGLLKPYKGEPSASLDVLPPMKHGRACPQLAEIIKGRLACGVQELLVRWEGQAMTNATWVELAVFWREFPSFNLKDELIVGGWGGCHDWAAVCAPAQEQSYTDQALPSGSIKISSVVSLLGHPVGVLLAFS
jgi:hypothetical protein